MLTIRRLEIPELIEIVPRIFEDERGFFSETYNKKMLADAGFTREFVQDNQSFSADPNVIRGLHFQSPPFAQDKLLRVISGAILDVAVDIRRGSPTFGKWVSLHLSAEKWNQLLVPVGFAHGICTLAPNTQIVYKVTDFYAPDHDHGLRWDDPDLAIDWPVGANDAILSDKDHNQPFFKDFDSPFDHQD